MCCTSCTGGDQPAAEAIQTEPSAASPTTSAAELWQHLESEVYAQNWQRWPGTTEFYVGNDPHGALLTTYVNDTALNAVTNKSGQLPTGSIIVKENYMPDRTLAATTVMYKASGYDSQHSDWFWMKRLADGTVEAEGRVEGCISCHGMVSDYIFTSQLK